ncbi:MAG: N-acetyltransferase [Clostridia bacterium]|nr:N-acetyltransferase [Clostridia bacterium]
MKIKSKRLLLSPMALDELRAAIVSETNEHMKAAYSEMLQGCLDHPHEYLWYTAWLIFLKDGTRAGSFCFMGPPENGAVEIGYGIDKGHVGNGYATEAVIQMCDWAFSNSGVYFIDAETDSYNTASQAVLRKAGFIPTGKSGDEGPRFELEKEKSNWMPIMMCLGLATGCSIGVSADSTGMGISLGICFGLAIGSVLDADDRKKRARLRQLRDANNN